MALSPGEQTKGGALAVREAATPALEHLRTLAAQHNLPIIDLTTTIIDPGIAKLIPYDFARRERVIAFRRDGRRLTIAVADPTNLGAIDAVAKLTSYLIDPHLAPAAAIDEAIDSAYGTGGGSYRRALEAAPQVEVHIADDADKDPNLVDLTRSAEEAPLVRLVNDVLIAAISQRASDVHFEPFEHELRVRFRVDGVLQVQPTIPAHLKAPVLSRIKIMAKLDIAERRKPQDGRIRLSFAAASGPRGVSQMDFRVSVLPTRHGEKAVLRLLGESALQTDLTELGFAPDQLAAFEHAIRQPQGMILVTGPTGSGKTTTLYSALGMLNDPGRNINTVEDPIEYDLRGINQVQVDEAAERTFPNVLRSFLRQDPDVIMVGEIRDVQTAEIAFKAAMTGHLVLSTLHTNDAPATLERLNDMGVEPFLVTSTVKLVVAQRLVRRLCEECKRLTDARPETLAELGMDPTRAETVRIYQPVGCSACNHTGYHGRVALYEVMPVEGEVKRAVLNRENGDQIKRAAVTSGMRTLRQSGLDAIAVGITTSEEVCRVTMGD